MMTSPLSSVDLAVAVIATTGSGVVVGTVDPDWIVAYIAASTSFLGLIWFFVRNLLLASARKAEQDLRIALLEALRNEFDKYVEENKDIVQGSRERIGELYERVIALESKKTRVPMPIKPA